MLRCRVRRNRWAAYEAAKAALDRLALTPAQRDAALREIIRRLRI